MNKIDEVMINVFGKIEATTANIYYNPLKQIIGYIETISPQHYIIFCQNCIKREAKKIAEFYKMECIETSYLPKNTLMVVADKENMHPNYKEAIKQLNNKINNT